MQWEGTQLTQHRRTTRNERDIEIGVIPNTNDVRVYICHLNRTSGGEGPTQPRQWNLYESYIEHSYSLLPIKEVSGRILRRQAGSCVRTDKPIYVYCVYINMYLCIYACLSL